MSKQTRDWINHRFLEWQSSQRKRKTVAQFAEWLGIPKGSLDNYISKGKTPKSPNLEILADKLGDEIYDLAGVERPDPRLRRIAQIASQLPPEAKDELMRIAEEIRRREEARRGNADETPRPA